MIDISRPSHNALHAFCIRPNLRFETQAQGEEVLLVVRAHPITFIPWIFNSVVLLIILVFLNVAVGSFLAPIQLLFIDIFFVILVLSYIFFNILTYIFNVGIITNKRIIDVDFYAVIYKEVTETRFQNIEDVTAKSGGYFASLFNFGDVFIQTAGAEINIEFLKIPRPSDVVTIINSLKGT